MNNENFNKFLLIVIIFLLSYIIIKDNNSGKLFASSEEVENLKKKVQKIYLQNDVFKGNSFKLNVENDKFNSNHVSITTFSKNTIILVDSANRVMNLYNIQANIDNGRVDIKLMASKRY